VNDTHLDRTVREGFYLDGIKERGDYTKILRWAIGMLEEFSKFIQKGYLNATATVQTV
jgi:hypothetical protein